jgi:hypothetical protein
MFFNCIYLKTINLNAEALIAFFALLLSLIVFIKTSRFNRKTIQLTIDHFKLSIKPLLQESYQIDDEKYEISCYLKNNGPGPAIIKELNFTYKDKSYKGVKTLLYDNKSSINLPGEFNIEFTDIFTNSILSSSDKIRLYKITSPSSKGHKEITKISNYISVNIIYEDVYGDRFISIPRNENDNY